MLGVSPVLDLEVDSVIEESLVEGVGHTGVS